MNYIYVVALPYNASLHRYVEAYNIFGYEIVFMIKNVVHIVVPPGIGKVISFKISLYILVFFSITSAHEQT